MANARKDIMRCKQQSDCRICARDCRRAELVAKENGIRTDLLVACEALFSRIERRHIEHQAICKLGKNCPEAKELRFAEAAIKQAKGE